jgi:aminopeptidase-like protein
MKNGKEIYDFLKEIFPICRSITGKGNRETLAKVQEHIPIEIKEVPTGYNAYDWEVPLEWNIKDAYIRNPNGIKIANFKKNNLHVVNYSEPVNKTISLPDLQKHLYSIPTLPSAIPYITSYYNRSWGFCISDYQRKNLVDGQYEVYIDSSLEKGSMTYGELIIPGDTEEEILLTTYICHPSMANNECSGIAVTTFLAKWLMSQNNKYTYRIVFAPETLGAIVYINKNYDILKKNVIAGFNITCVGDDNAYSFMPSREGNTLADRVATHVLDKFTDQYKTYSFLERGSDERQYCHPSIDLPVVSIMRSKYGTYPEYHTSLDNLDFVSPKGLYGAYSLTLKCLEALETNGIYENAVKCEPKMSKRGLHPKSWHTRHLGTSQSEGLKKQVSDMMNTMVYCDGKKDLIELSNKINLTYEECHQHIVRLEENGVIRKVR